jgi:disulfide bond formation protein DsbB
MDNNSTPDRIPTPDIQSGDTASSQPAAQPQQPLQDQAPAPRNSMKALQPISSDLTPSSATPAPAINLPFNTPPPRAAASSIYPAAIHGTIPPAPDPSTTEPAGNLASQSDKTKIIVACIWLIGAFIAIPAALSLFGTVKILSYGIGGGTGGLVTAIEVVDVLVGVGIIFRKEMARIVYIVLAIIGFILSLYGTTIYFKDLHAVSNSESQAITSTQNEITNYQNNTSIPSAQRQQVVSELQQDLAHEKKEQKPVFGLLNLIPDYFIALVPLIFLTRPSVKEQFS